MEAEKDPYCKGNKSWGNPYTTSNIMRGKISATHPSFWNKSSPQKSKDHETHGVFKNKKYILGREFQASQSGNYDFHTPRKNNMEPKNHLHLKRNYHFPNYH